MDARRVAKIQAVADDSRAHPLIRDIARRKLAEIKEPILPGWFDFVGNWTVDPDKEVLEAPFHGGRRLRFQILKTPGGFAWKVSRTRPKSKMTIRGMSTSREAAKLAMWAEHQKALGASSKT